jgi:hypothetical protein
MSRVSQRFFVTATQQTPNRLYTAGGFLSMSCFHNRIGQTLKDHFSFVGLCGYLQGLTLFNRLQTERPQLQAMAPPL